MLYEVITHGEDGEAHRHGIEHEVPVLQGLHDHVRVKGGKVLFRRFRVEELYEDSYNFV